MIFQYLYPYWLREGSIIQDRGVYYRVLIGFYGFYIDFDRMDKEIFPEFGNAVHSFFTEDYPSFPFISLLYNGPYGDVYNIPEGYVEEILHPYYRADPIFIDRYKDRYFFFGDRIIHVSKDTTSIIDETDEEVIELPSYANEWSISFFSYVTTLRVVEGTLFEDNHLIVCRTVEDVDIFYIYDTYMYNEYKHIHFDLDWFPYPNMINYDHARIYNLPDKDKQREHNQDISPTGIRINSPKLVDRSFTYGDYTIFISDTSVKIAETYPPILMIQRRPYCDIAIIYII